LSTHPDKKQEFKNNKKEVEHSPGLEPGTYSAAINCSCVGRRGKKVWNRNFKWQKRSWALTRTRNRNLKITKRKLSTHPGEEQGPIELQSIVLVLGGGVKKYETGSKNGKKEVEHSLGQETGI
jgi:hypothetical protein